MWYYFQKFCFGYKVNHQFVSFPPKVKFIYHMYNNGVSHAVMFIAVATVSKYHIIYKNSGINVDKQPRKYFGN